MHAATPAIDLAAIRAELAADGIATANPELEAALRPVLDSAADRGIPELRVVVIDETLPVASQAHDIANKLVDDLGGTVVVRSPLAGGASSTELPRAALSAGEHDMMSTPDYPGGLDAFIEAAAGHHIPWSEINYAMAAVVLALAIILPTVWWLRARAAVRRGGGGIRR
ncbi:Rv1476 family membrane protein [Corynebacterium sphenisci]|uniref:Rv1476 family membrane protein n=1 Tax=Corynebacterium sphenisci TaxID=191493 RepID=UPI0026DFF746|nr:DUF6676 family protein [Corynebacterium sphenisci]MDO5729996.1 hypothetical protein [Corynebacterium sphenisci]